MSSCRSYPRPPQATLRLTVHLASPYPHPSTRLFLLSTACTRIARVQASRARTNVRMILVVVNLVLALALATAELPVPL